MIRIKQNGKELIHVHTPKTGGTTVSELLVKLFDSELANEVNGKQANHLPLKFINVGNAKTFTVVRNPIAWHESLWKMLNDLAPQAKGARRRGWNPVGISALMYDKDFSTFIDNILDKAPDWQSEVFAWYSGVDYYIRTESLLVDLNEVLRKEGFDYNEKDVLNARNYGVRNGIKAEGINWKPGQQEEILSANAEYCKKHFYEGY